VIQKLVNSVKTVESYRHAVYFCCQFTDSFQKVWHTLTKETELAVGLEQAEMKMIYSVIITDRFMCNELERLRHV